MSTSTIKDYFKFEFSDTGNIFYCIRKNASEYMVCWNAEDAKTEESGHTTYSGIAVEKCITKGTWKVIEDEIKHVPADAETQFNTLQAMFAEMSDTVNAMNFKLHELEDRIIDISENIEALVDSDININSIKINPATFASESVETECLSCKDCDCEEDDLFDSESNKTTSDEYVDITNEAVDLIGELLEKPQLPINLGGKVIGYDYIPDYTTGEFVINDEKGTTVVLLRNSNGRVVKRGFAKLNKKDKFNPAIGMIIALHRVFDLPVPQKFLTINS
jgi:hypothetical protein